MTEIIVRPTSQTTQGNNSLLQPKELFMVNAIVSHFDNLINRRAAEIIDDAN